MSMSSKFRNDTPFLDLATAVPLQLDRLFKPHFSRTSAAPCPSDSDLTMNVPAFTAPCTIARARFLARAAISPCQPYTQVCRSTRMHPRMVTTPMEGDANVEDIVKPLADAVAKQDGETSRKILEENKGGVADVMEAMSEASRELVSAEGEVTDEELELEDGDDDDEDLSDVEPCSPPQYVLNGEAIAAAREKFKRHETDCGSPEYQIATLTTRIGYLTTHLKQNPKDFSSTRGLLKMVATRRRLLKYLKREDESRFKSIIAGLGIRVSQQLREL